MHHWSKSALSQQVIKVGGLVTLIFFALLFYPFSDSYYNPIEARLSDAFHLPMGVGMSLVFMWICTRLGLSLAFSFICVVIGGSILGGIGEVLQPYFGRGESLDDWLNGVMGLFIGSSGYFIFWGTSKRMLPKVIWFFGAATLQSIALVPAWHAYQIVKERELMFPQFTDFSSQHEVFIWKRSVESGNLKLRIENKDGINFLHFIGSGVGYPGGAIALPRKSWEGYSKLKIDLMGRDALGPNATPRVNVRIDDCHDCKEFDSRYNQSFEVGAEETVLSIPLEQVANTPKDRQLDLSCITRIVIFTEVHGEDYSFGVKNISLE